ncbi:hypothetical protein PROFUN_12983 [Planoprotostelium fungivorum]|uniref:Uncharacterized protein n=1 Tax=Planoprotostelium fungivorum TaxID=1890364 RepID=A0A2P6N607_9EUKA|nr:hypothetical protein PROFUN_12983 [Planoprotostelium fungivorum]
MSRLVFLLALVLLVRGDICTFLPSQCNGTTINNTLPACWSCSGNNTTPSQMDAVIIKELDLSQGTFGDLHVQRVELYDSSVTADTFTLVDLFVDANSTLRASSIFVDGNVDGGGSFIAQDVHLTSMNSKNWTIKSVRVSESLYITPIETPDAIITLSGSDALLNLNQIFFSQPAETFNHLEKSITIFKMINGSISLTPSSNASSVCYTLERHIEGNKLTVRPSGVEINLQWSESDDHLGNRIFSARLPPSIPCINVTSLTAQLGESKHSFTVKTEGDHNYTATVPLSAFPACTTVITLTTQGTVQGQVVRMIDTYPITPAEVSTYGMNVTGISSSLNSQRNNITYEWNTTSINQQTVCGMVPVSMKMNEEAVDIGSRMLIVLFATPICPPFTDGFSLNYNTSIWTPKVVPEISAKFPASNVTAAVTFGPGRAVFTFNATGGQFCTCGYSVLNATINSKLYIINDTAHNYTLTFDGLNSGSHIDYQYHQTCVVDGRTLASSYLVTSDVFVPTSGKFASLIFLYGIGVSVVVIVIVIGIVQLRKRMGQRGTSEYQYVPS